LHWHWCRLSLREQKTRLSGSVLTSRSPAVGRNIPPGHPTVYTHTLRHKGGDRHAARQFSHHSRRNEYPMPEHVKKKLEEEIQTLEHELNHDLPRELKKAVAMGDLSENAEYHMAKQRQEFVRARLGQLKKRMAELSLVNLANIPRDKVAFGSTVVVFDNTKSEEIEYKLVTSEESDVTKGLISTTSPIGRGLMGKKVGDTAVVVTPNGNRELEVLKLTTIHDEAAAAGEEAAR